MDAAVDWEQVFHTEIMARNKTAKRVLSAADKFNYVLEWEKEDVLPQLKQLYYVAISALSSMDQASLRGNLLLVETELFVRNPMEPEKFYTSPYSHPDYTVVLPKDVLDLHPVLDKTFPLSQIHDERDGWTGEARLIHPMLTRTLVRLIERDEHVIKAIHPQENGNMQTGSATALSRLTLQ